jgi:hypothetical protein
MNPGKRQWRFRSIDGWSPFFDVSRETPGI